MLEKDTVSEIIKSYFPEADDSTVEAILQDVVSDVEAIVHSMIRQAVSQARENLYRKKMRE